MSKNLQYKIIVPIEKTCLPDELKFILRRRYELDQGPHRLKYEDRCYLQGLADADIDGAEKLLSLLDENRTIEIFEE